MLRGVSWIVLWSFRSSAGCWIRLHRGKFVLFRLCQVVDLTDVGVGEFLYFLETVALIIFRDLFVLQHLLQTLIGIAPDVANCGAVILRDFMDLLRQLFAT